MLNTAKMKALREGLKLTQEQAANKAQMKTRQQWNDIENGRKSPTLETLNRIAAALGVSAGDLIE